MFCARKPGLLLSTMRAMDNLGLDIQQAVISCFNGFAMDIFRAEVRILVHLKLNSGYKLLIVNTCTLLINIHATAMTRKLYIVLISDKLVP